MSDLSLETQSAQQLGASLRAKTSVIWIAVLSDAVLPQLELLRTSLQEAHRSDDIVVTRIGGQAKASQHDDGHDLEMPSNLTQLRHFIETWQPDVTIWLGDRFPARFVSHLFDEGIRQIWVAQTAALEAMMLFRARRLKHAIDAFSKIFVPDFRSLQRLTRRGVAADRIFTVGPLAKVARARSYDDTLRRACAEFLGQRPIWLVDALELSEIPALARAHRAASFRSHRLLCLAAVSDEGSAAKACRAFSTCGLNAAIYRLDGNDVRAIDVPDFEGEGFENGAFKPEATRFKSMSSKRLNDMVQVLIVQGGTHLGLWLSLSPMTFLGGSLEAGVMGAPLEVAASGSALICGPQTGEFSAEIEAFVAADGCLCAENALGITSCVEQLLPADRCAEVAQNAWEIVTRAPDSLGQINRAVRQILDGS